MSEAVYKSVEITGTSTVNVTDAVENAIAKASETLRHMAWFELVTVRNHRLGRQAVARGGESGRGLSYWTCSEGPPPSHAIARTRV